MALPPIERCVAKFLALRWRRFRAGCDTVEVIRNWWLLECGCANVMSKHVTDALAWLQAAGAIEGLRTRDARMRYRRRESTSDADLDRLVAMLEAQKPDGPIDET